MNWRIYSLFSDELSLSTTYSELTITGFLVLLKAIDPTFILAGLYANSNGLTSL